MISPACPCGCAQLATGGAQPPPSPHVIEQLVDAAITDGLALVHADGLLQAIDRDHRHMAVGGPVHIRRAGHLAEQYGFTFDVGVQAELVRTSSENSLGSRLLSMLGPRSPVGAQVILGPGRQFACFWPPITPPANRLSCRVH